MLTGISSPKEQQMIAVTLILQAKPGAEQAMAQFWTQAARQVLEEDPGCRLLHVQRDASDPHRFIVFEIYGSQAELDRHNQSDLSKRLLPGLMELLAGPPQVINGELVA
jgi:quinol monooxygenase YgiN